MTWRKIFLAQLVGNKAKGQILKVVFQEGKARQNFRKTNISYPLIRTRTCAYQGVRNVLFDALRDIVPFVQFKKHEKRPWRNVTLEKLQISTCNVFKSNTLP